MCGVVCWGEGSTDCKMITTHIRTYVCICNTTMSAVRQIQTRYVYTYVRNTHINSTQYITVYFECTNVTFIGCCRHLYLRMHIQFCIV